jgi:hypothetical protein
LSDNGTVVGVDDRHSLGSRELGDPGDQVPDVVHGLRGVGREVGRLKGYC